MAACPDSTSDHPSRVFRATFLTEIEQPEHRASVVAFGELLLDLVFESPLAVCCDQTTSAISCTKESLIAALDELQQSSSYLINIVGRSIEVFDLDEDDAEIAKSALVLGFRIKQLIEAEERFLK